jgi:hypothetical protein
MLDALEAGFCAWLVNVADLRSSSTMSGTKAFGNLELQSGEQELLGRAK